MRIIDLSTCAADAAPETVLDADVCVVGSGPAGATLAAQLNGTALRVLVIESGTAAYDPAPDPRDDIESTGVPRVMDQSKLRARTLGGASALWCGRCVTFERLDYSRRDWVPHSGWPVGPEELNPYFDRAATWLGLGPNTYDAALWPSLTSPRPTPEPDPRQVVSSFWQYSLDPKDSTKFRHFGQDLAEMSSSNVRVLAGATVTHVNSAATAEADGGRTVTSLEVADTRGRRFRVTGRLFVLAAGGIENPRLLLASDRDVAGGLGNAHDLVGRFLMDHPRCTIGEFDAKDIEAVLSRFGIYQLNDATGSHPYSHGLALSPELQADERLLNCAAWLTETRADDDPWDAIKRLRSGESTARVRDACAVLRHPLMLARGAHRRLVQGRGVVHKIDRLLLDCIVEQRPDPASRLTLSGSRDPLGVPLPSLHWLVSDQEKRTVIRFGRAIVESLAAAGLPTPRLVPWVRDGRAEDATFRDVAHPTGTTRMSADPAEGVVDPDCRVYGTDNLFVAGSSVFPTAGHGNPTLMLVAFAIRLADHLRERAASTQDVSGSLSRVLTGEG